MEALHDGKFVVSGTLSVFMILEIGDTNGILELFLTNFPKYAGPKDMSGKILSVKQIFREFNIVRMGKRD